MAPVFVFDMVVHHLDVYWDVVKPSIYPLVTCRWTFLWNFKSGETNPTFRENVVAMNFPTIVDDPNVFQFLSLSTDLRQKTSEVSGTVVRWARTADREVQRGDGK